MPTATRFDSAVKLLGHQHTVAWDQLISLLATDVDQAHIELILGRSAYSTAGAGRGNPRLPHLEQHGDMMRTFGIRIAVRSSIRAAKLSLTMAMTARGQGRTCTRCVVMTGGLTDRPAQPGG